MGTELKILLLINNCSFKRRSLPKEQLIKPVEMKMFLVLFETTMNLYVHI